MDRAKIFQKVLKDELESKVESEMRKHGFKKIDEENCEHCGESFDRWLPKYCTKCGKRLWK